MASIIRMSNGRKAVQFTTLDDKRPVIRLGKCSRRNAETVGRHVEALVAVKIQNSTPDDETSKWVRNIADALHCKLVRAGLVTPRRVDISPTVAELLQGSEGDGR